MSFLTGQPSALITAAFNLSLSCSWCLHLYRMCSTVCSPWSYGHIGLWIILYLCKYDLHGYSRFKSTQSLPFFTTNLSTSFASLTVLLPQSRDCSRYVTRPILAPPPLWLHQQIDLRAHDFAHCLDLWQKPRLVNVTCALSWRLCGINLAVCVFLCNTYQYALLVDYQLLDARSLTKAFFGIHTHTHTRTRIYMHTHTYIHTHTHSYTHTYIHTFIHIYIHTYLHTLVHTHIQDVPRGMDKTSGECSLCWTIPI